MPHQSSKRYVMEAAPPPNPRPRWYRTVWLIRDTRTSNCAVIAEMLHWGAADRYVRCLNAGDSSSVLCRGAGPDSHAERWAMAS